MMITWLRGLHSHQLLSCCLQVCFVDLRPVPADAKAVSPEGFAVLLALLSSAEKLDGWELADVVDAADLETKVSL